ncbi:MAG: ABC-2 type transport system ATP-binding protein [Alphaproteobacteria bacterium]|jgi:ABC-2 type transport system ATP-binding protein
MNFDTPALVLDALGKSFDRPAVVELGLQIAPGEFYGLVGPNGAGKTTTLKMIAGLLRPDSGGVSIFGIDALKDPLAARRIVAWVSDEPMIYEKLTPMEYLEFVAGLWELPAAVAEGRARALIERLDLGAVAHDRCQGFSKGMRQKVALAGALVHDPKLIVLDEPLTGLDAASAREVKDVFQERQQDGAAVIMTTHILDVAERMAERIGVIAEGRLIAEGDLAGLRRQAGMGDRSLEDVFLELVAGELVAGELVTGAEPTLGE